MAGGPIFPCAAVPTGTAGNVFPWVYSGAGANAAPLDEGLGVAASLAANATYSLRFRMPPSIPTGTLKLSLTGICSSAGNAILTVADALVTPGNSPSSATLVTEANFNAATLALLADKYGELKAALANLSPAGNEMVVLALTFNNTGWTLANIAAFYACLLWE